MESPTPFDDESPEPAADAVESHETEDTYAVGFVGDRPFELPASEYDRLERYAEDEGMEMQAFFSEFESIAPLLVSCVRAHRTFEAWIADSFDRPTEESVRFLRRELASARSKAPTENPFGTAFTWLYTLTELVEVTLGLLSRSLSSLPVFEPGRERPAFELAGGHDGDDLRERLQVAAVESTVIGLCEVLRKRVPGHHVTLDELPTVSR